MSHKKLIFVVTEDWYFYSHRKPMIRAAQSCGYDVSVITHIDKHKKEIEDLGVKVIEFSFERRSLNPIKALSQINKLKKIYAEQKPEIVHHIAMKPILYGSFAAWFSKVPKVLNAFAGLGYVFNARTVLAMLVRLGLWLPFIILMRRDNTWLLFQNQDDEKTLKDFGYVVDERSLVIRGSGIDLEEYPQRSFPDLDGKMFCAFAGRMIEIKGLPTLQEAFDLLENNNVPAELHLYGRPDAQNPGSWNEARLRAWENDSDNVIYEGHADDMRAEWGKAHIAIQVSYGGEGVPKSLLEAAACGVAIIASDVPGCREVVIDGENGFLIDPYDANALAHAIEKLSFDPELCKRMGEKSRIMVESDMSADNVQKQTAALYERIVSDL